MCKRCVESLTELFPELSEEEQYNILFSFTAFPFTDDSDLIHEQLVHFKEVGPEQIMREFDDQYEKAMLKIREKIE